LFCSMFCLFCLSLFSSSIPYLYLSHPSLILFTSLPNFFPLSLSQLWLWYSRAVLFLLQFVYFMKHQHRTSQWEEDDW
jgi:hypothetical protein